MNFANTKHLSILWIGAFFIAFSLHVVLGVQLYFQNIGVSSDVVSPVMTITFVQEITHTDFDRENIDADLDRGMDPEVQQFDFFKQDQEMLVPEINEFKLEETPLENLQPVAQKNDFIASQSLKQNLAPEMTRKIIVKKTSEISKIVKKQHHDVKAARSHVSAQKNNAATLEDMLLMQWLTKVQEQLEKQKQYVVRQRISYAKGTVQLEFRVHEHGYIVSRRIARSSGDKDLDRLAMAALQRVGILPPPPLSKVNKIIRVSLIFY
ncbi:TonB family protein [Bartonella sp. F02]|uniref:TonB family protein n=1 Tax=Bartonella sp. F02 TaxID=2967262 RepID=UPI0022A9516A|nr:TonB family protein [Bartonella sp. F02]MCZ2328522.1 TonB family protein [Bartonella sp. F02]